MVACSARFSTVLGRAAKPWGHLQYEWQWAQHDLHGGVTTHIAAEHGTVPNTRVGGATRCPPEGASSLEGGDCPVWSLHQVKCAQEGDGKLEYTIGGGEKNTTNHTKKKKKRSPFTKRLRYFQGILKRI